MWCKSTTQKQKKNTLKWNRRRGRSSCRRGCGGGLQDMACTSRKEMIIYRKIVIFPRDRDEKKSKRIAE